MEMETNIKIAAAAIGGAGDMSEFRVIGVEAAQPM
jgi:hypothetical protein